MKIEKLGEDQGHTTRLDLDPTILRKSTTVYQLKHTAAEAGPVKLAALIWPAAEARIARPGGTG